MLEYEPVWYRGVGALDLDFGGFYFGIFWDFWDFLGFFGFFLGFLGNL